MILGVNNDKDGVNNDKDVDDDSAYEDPNTESLKSRPKSARPGDNVMVQHAMVLPPTKVSHVTARVPMPRDNVDGITKLNSDTGTALPKSHRMSQSPVRNLFPDTERGQSRSSTLVDADSLQDDKSPR